MFVEKNYQSIIILRVTLKVRVQSPDTLKDIIFTLLLNLLAVPLFADVQKLNHILGIDNFCKSIVFYDHEVH